MFRIRGGRNAKKSAQVWLLGRDHPGADRSLKWDGRFGNLSDPDVLIVDLTGLTVDVLQRIDKRSLDQAQIFIRDKLLHGGTIVVIAQPEFSTSNRPLTGRPASPYGRATVDPYIYSNYHILPINITTTKVPPGSTIRAVEGHCFKDYIDAVNSYDFIINTVAAKIPPSPAGERGALLYQMQKWDVRDNSGHLLGLALAALGPDVRSRQRSAPCSGHLVLLPLPTKPIDEAIGRILSVYKDAAPSAEAPPAWTKDLLLKPAGKHREEIAELERRKAEIQDKIDELRRRDDRILAHVRLLYSTGPELEYAVVQAFKALGFADIVLLGDTSKEDAAFAMDSASGYSHGVIEAKGAGKKIKTQHIQQCHKWAKRRAAAKGRPSKGIFVPNQHRLEPYPKSSNARMTIEADQLEQADLDDVCIIPSCALFEAVRRVLDGEAPDRARIARKIAATKGVLADVL